MHTQKKYHCGLKSSKRIWKHALTTPLLMYVSTKEGMRLLHISVKNHDTQAEKGKFIYKALTLHGKQFLQKCDRLQSHQSAV